MNINDSYGVENVAYYVELETTYLPSTFVDFTTFTTIINCIRGYLHLLCIYTSIILWMHIMMYDYTT